MTPTETHNPLELHATTAVWEDSKLTLYETTQSMFNTRNVLAQMFGLPQENVRVVTKFLGLASAASCGRGPIARCRRSRPATSKAVKIVISRKMMFQTVGHRPSDTTTRAAGRNRRRETGFASARLRRHQAILDDYHEDCGETTAFLYSVPNLRHFGRARRNVGSPTSMRGPGAVPGPQPNRR